MAVAASFVAVVGVPLLLGTAVGMVPARGATKLALGASFPVILLLIMAAASPFDLSEIGLGPVAAIAIFGWLFGFALADSVRSAWRSTTR